MISPAAISEEESAPLADMSQPCFPLSALAVQEDGGKSIEPSVGDPVEFTGTIARVENGNAYIAVESVNGEPYTPPAPEVPAELGESDLMGMAAADDQQNFNQDI